MRALGGAPGEGDCHGLHHGVLVSRRTAWWRAFIMWPQGPQGPGTPRRSNSLLPNSRVSWVRGLLAIRKTFLRPLFVNWIVCNSYLLPRVSLLPFSSLLSSARFASNSFLSDYFLTCLLAIQTWSCLKSFYQLGRTWRSRPHIDFYHSHCFQVTTSFPWLRRGFLPFPTDCWLSDTGTFHVDWLNTW